MEKYLKTMKSLIILAAYAFVLILILDIILKTVLSFLSFSAFSGLWVVVAVFVIIHKDKIVKFLKALEGGNKENSK